MTRCWLAGWGGRIEAGDQRAPDPSRSDFPTDPLKECHCQKLQKALPDPFGVNRSKGQRGKLLNQANSRGWLACHFLATTRFGLAEPAVARASSSPSPRRRLLQQGPVLRGIDAAHGTSRGGPASRTGKTCELGASVHQLLSQQGGWPARRHRAAQHAHPTVEALLSSPARHSSRQTRREASRTRTPEARSRPCLQQPALQRLNRKRAGMDPAGPDADPPRLRHVASGSCPAAFKQLGPMDPGRCRRCA